MDNLQTITTGEFSKEKFVEFAIRSDHLDPEIITAELGLIPSRAHMKGDRYLGKHRNPDTGAIETGWHERQWSIWVVDSKEVAVAEKLEQHVLNLLAKLEPKAEKLEQWLSREAKCTISFYIWWRPEDGEGSYLISSKTIQRMSNLCHHVEFAFFA